MSKEKKGGFLAKFKRDNENGARKGVLEELFYDFNRSRAEVYKMNFVRGLFFGVGSVLGGTLLVAIVVWVLSLFTDIPGGVGNFVQDVINRVNQPH